MYKKQTGQNGEFFSVLDVQNVAVRRSNIIFCDICCFRSASCRMSSL